MNKLEKVGAKLISDLTNGSEFGWPPECAGFIYQPTRPVHLKEEETMDEKVPADNCK